jgi:hypothetical protein
VKTTLFVFIAVAVVIVAVMAIGTMLPKRHIVSRSAVFHAGAEKLFSLANGTQAWRPDVKTCTITEHNGQRYQQETDRHGHAILYEVEAADSDRIVRRIATHGLPFGGSWTITFTPEDGKTRVRITEDGEVYNPVFRFISKFVMGETATIDAYLKAMGKTVGEDVEIGK